MSKTTNKYAHLAKRDDPAKMTDRARRDVALRIEVRCVFDANFRVYGVRLPAGGCHHRWACRRVSVTRHFSP